MKIRENLLPVASEEPNSIEQPIEKAVHQEDQQQAEVIFETDTTVKEESDHLEEEEHHHKSDVSSKSSKESLGKSQEVEEDQEMNRWNASKLDNVLIRNRPEISADQCNQLLLSFRELTEWIIKKETELTSQPAIGGDVAVILRQQEENKNLRRQLEEKRNLIENSLLAGRQYVAKEDLGHTESSDSEGLHFMSFLFLLNLKPFYFNYL